MVDRVSVFSGVSPWNKGGVRRDQAPVGGTTGRGTSRSRPNLDFLYSLRFVSLVPTRRLSVQKTFHVKRETCCSRIEIRIFGSR